MKPIRIDHLITELNVGGAERMLEKLVLGMDRGKFQNRVVSMSDRGPIGERLGERDIPVHSLGMRPGRPSIAGAWRLSRLLGANPPDIVQTWLYHADLLGLISGRLHRRIKVVWGIRNSSMRMENYRRLSRLVVRINSRLSPLADAIIVNSQRGIAAHRSLGYANPRMICIPNGFDTDRFCPAPAARAWLREEIAVAPDTVLVGMVARRDPQKDHATFLRAAARLLAKNPDVHFVLAGKDVAPDQPGIHEFLHVPRLAARTHCLGVRKDVPHLLAAMDIVTLSSAYGEGFPNCIGEAMACGRPCVVTDVGDSAMLVDSTGRVVPPGKPAALAAAWQDLLSADREGRHRLGLAARQRIVDHYQMTHIVKRFEIFYDQLLAGSSGIAS